jgi:Cu-Zn family superoxide dismutase
MGHGNMMHSGAVATLGPTQGNAVTGLVRFDQRGDTVWVHAHVVGLAPNSVHGFHIHDKGSCASTDGTSAGGHFNPEGRPHGPQDAAHHAGDMPNLQADGQGVADASFELHGITIGSGSDNIVGRSVVIHGGPDDYKSQPAGNSGPRVACGVIASW